jgi:hypothetical protein
MAEILTFYLSSDSQGTTNLLISFVKKKIKANEGKNLQLIFFALSDFEFSCDVKQ